MYADNTQHGSRGATGATRSADSQRRDAEQQVTEAMQVVQKMKSDPQVKQLLSRAKGVFLVPDYGRGAIGVGASGVAMILMNDDSARGEGSLGRAISCCGRTPKAPLPEPS